VKTCPKCFYENSDDSRFCQKCGTNLGGVSANVEKEPLVGKMLAGNFQIRRKIAVGGMGSIYEAEQVSLSKQVCIKVLHKHLLRDATIIKRFHREARAASRLKHPNCINVIDFGQAENGILYLAMDFVEGVDLATLLDEEFPLGADRIIRVLSQVSMALDEAHEHNIIHRDLKPENIMVEQRRHQPDFVTVLDFGIAKIKEPGKDDRETFQTMAGVVCGTPEYMSPEQIRGDELDSRSDIYSMGVIMWQLFTRRLPFAAATPIATVTKHLTESAEPPSRFCRDIPPAMERLILRMLSKKPGERPQSALEVKERMDEVVELLRSQTGGGAAAPKAAAAASLRSTPARASARPEITDDQKAAVGAMSLGGAGDKRGARRERRSATAPPSGQGQRKQRPAETAAVQRGPGAAVPSPKPKGGGKLAPTAAATRGPATGPQRVRVERPPGQRPPAEDPSRRQERARASTTPDNDATMIVRGPIRDELQRAASAIAVDLDEDNEGGDLGVPVWRRTGFYVSIAAAILLLIGSAFIIGPWLSPPRNKRAQQETQAQGGEHDRSGPEGGGGDEASASGYASGDGARGDNLEGDESPSAAALKRLKEMKLPPEERARQPRRRRPPRQTPTVVASNDTGEAPLVEKETPKKPKKVDTSQASKYERMGDEKFQAGKYAEAKVYFKMSLNHSSNPILYKKIGYCHKNLGNLSSAQTAFRKYVAALPADIRKIQEEILKGQGLL
jgi:tRNA A-37 threonylcarbamoyl transferase component Bud32